VRTCRREPVLPHAAQNEDYNLATFFDFMNSLSDVWRPKR
jgi:hypothetical protein